jgi:hypothetical protein
MVLRKKTLNEMQFGVSDEECRGHKEIIFHSELNRFRDHTVLLRYFQITQSTLQNLTNQQAVQIHQD